MSRHRLSAFFLFRVQDLSQYQIKTDPNPTLFSHYWKDRTISSSYVLCHRRSACSLYGVIIQFVFKCKTQNSSYWIRLPTVLSMIGAACLAGLVHGVHRYSQFFLVWNYFHRHPDCKLANLTVKVSNRAVNVNLRALLTCYPRGSF